MGAVGFAFNVNNPNLSLPNYRMCGNMVLKDEQTTKPIYRLILPFKTYSTKALNGYYNGDGGRMRLVMCRVNPTTGEPDLTKIFGRAVADFNPITRIAETRAAYSISGNNQLAYIDLIDAVTGNAGVSVIPDTPFSWVVWNRAGATGTADTDEGTVAACEANFASMNSPTGMMDAGTLGYVHNTATLTKGDGGVGDLDQRERVGWSILSGAPGSWRWGVWVGADWSTDPGGSSHPGNYGGGTGDDAGRFPWWGWTRSPGNVRARSNQPTYSWGHPTAGAGAKTTWFGAKQAMTLTEGNAYSPSGCTIRIRNPRTGVQGQVALPAGNRKGAFDTPVPFDAGDNGEVIVVSGSVYHSRTEEFITKIFGSGTSDAACNWTSIGTASSTDRLEAGGGPQWPFTYNLTGTVTPPVTPPTSGFRYGMTGDAKGWGQNSGRLAAWKGLGVQTCREEFNPSELDPGYGHPGNVAANGDLFADAAANGIRIHPLLNPTQGQYLADPTGVVNWAAAFAAKFLLSTGSYWAGRADKAYAPDSIEICNEPYAGSDWTVSNFAAYAKAVIPAIKAAAPGAIVLCPVDVSTFVDGTMPTVGAANDWINSLINGLGSVRPDRWAVHPYNKDPSPGDPNDRWNFRRIETIRSRLVNKGASQNLWITEIGNATGNPPTISDTYTEAQQAEWLGEYVDLATGYGWCDAIFPYTWQDFQDYGASGNKEDYFGIRRHDGTAKPAVATYSGKIVTVTPPPPPPSTGSTRYRDQVAADGYTSWWPLGETAGATTVADQAGISAGTVLGDVTLGVPGLLAEDANTAASLGGSTGRIELGDVYGFEGKTPFSVEVWFKPDVVDATSRRILSKEHLDQGWVIEMDTRGITAIRMVAPTYEQCRWDISKIIPGQRHHVIFTFDGSTLRLYGNGVETIGNGSYSGVASSVSLPDIAEKLTIGAKSTTDGSNGGANFDGVIDEVIVYSGRVLSAQQALAHYELGTSSFPPATPAAPMVTAEVGDVQVDVAANTTDDDFDKFEIQRKEIVS